MSRARRPISAPTGVGHPYPYGYPTPATAPDRMFIPAIPPIQVPVSP